MFGRSCNGNISTCVGKVKHQRKGPNKMAINTVAVEVKSKVMFSITIVVEGRRLTVPVNYLNT